MALPFSHTSLRPKEKKNLQKINLQRMPQVQWAGRSLSATASQISSWRHGCLDLEHDPLMHIIEEHSKENPKLQRSQPITTDVGNSSS